jgi:hypothetical protein
MLERFVEGHNVSYIVTMNRVIDQHQLYMDATGIIEDAINQDIKSGYKPHNGPNYGIEVLRIQDYVNYVNSYVNRDDFFRFDTKKYKFFLGTTSNPKEINV